MKIKDGFVMRTVMGEHVIVAEGPEHINFNKIIALNKSAALLLERVDGKEFSVQELADILVGEYKIDGSRALADASKIVDELLENGIVEA